MSADTARPYRYRPPGPREIVGGHDALDQVPRLVEELGIKRALVVTSPSLVEEQRVLDLVLAPLGDHHVGTFDQVEPHSPIEMVRKALSAAQDLDVDTVVSVGGGSSVDTAKGIVWYYNEAAHEPPLTHIAVPSTLSGAEYTTDAGITLGEGKRVHRHDRIIPQAVVLDPRVLATAPMQLVKMSLLNALAHCLEGLISIGASPMTDAGYIHGVKLLHEASSRLDSDEGRIRAQGGAALAALHQVPVGLAHALAHVIGGRFRTPHGATHAIVGPAVMRFNLPVAASKQVAIAEAVGVDVEGLSDVEAAWEGIMAVQRWARELGTPPGLKDLGVPGSGIDQIAADVPYDPSYETNPRSYSNPEEVRAVVEWAWSGEIPSP